MPGHDDGALDREDRYWDDVVRGRTPPGVDPATVHVISATHAADDAAPPDPAFVRRLEAELRRAAASTAAPWGMPAINVAPNGHAPAAPNGFAPAPTHVGDRLRGPRRWVLPAAAVLLIGFGGVVGGLIASRADEPSERGSAILAPSPPSPTAAPVDAELFRLVLPPDALPTGGGSMAHLTYDTIPAHAVGRSAGGCCDGVLVQHVVSGAITFTVDSTVEVLRADGSRASVPANEPLALAAGDTLLSRSEYAATTTNAGPAAADVVAWVLLTGTSDPSTTRSGEGWEQRASTTTSHVQEMSGSVVVHLRREVLLPDETVVVPASSLTLSLAPDAESHVLKQVTGGILLPVDTAQDGPITYILTMVPRST